MKVKIEDVVIGMYEYDSIIIKENDLNKEIVFDKKDNVGRFKDKTVELIIDDGKYVISEFANNTKK